jgi:hypothetical protein
LKPLPSLLSLVSLKNFKYRESIGILPQLVPQLRR